MKSTLIYEWYDPNGDRNREEVEYPTLKEAKERFYYLVEQTRKLVEKTKVEYGKFWENYYHPYVRIVVYIAKDIIPNFLVKEDRMIWRLDTNEIEEFRNGENNIG